MTLSSSTTPRNNSLLRKSEARLAAAQCIYQHLMGSETLSPAQLITQYKEREKDSQEEEAYSVEPDYRYLQQLLEGWWERREETEQQLDACLLEGWTRKRMSPLMVAILYCALSERVLHPELKPAIWVDEYATLAGSFFSGEEVGFVNRLLDSLSR